MVCNSVGIGQNLQNDEVFIQYSTVSLLNLHYVAIPI